MFLGEVLSPFEPQLLWILCLAFVIAFLLAFSVGANDVSNSFGTSVGSKVITVTWACILATIFETAGATLLGYSVCDTFRVKMYDVEAYDGAQKELMLGALACLIGSALWNLVATALKMPISGTHSIVGATVGFSVVSRGWSSIKWAAMSRIIASWFMSPLISGFLSSIIYIIISKTIIRKVDPLRYGLKALPLFYGATIFINVISIVLDGPKSLGLDTLPWYVGLFIALVCASLVISLVAILLAPKLRRDIMAELAARRASSGAKKLALAASSERHARRQRAYVNESFHSDEKPAAVTTSSFINTPPDGAAEPNGGDTKAAAAPIVAAVPPIAPKPAHLKRQGQRVRVAAPEAPAAADGQLEDIDLSGQIESASGGGGGESGGGSSSGAAAGQQKQQRQRRKDLESAPPPPPDERSTSPILRMGERYEVARLFSSLQILTACFASFAHGTNDVSNAVAPLIPIWNIYTTGLEDVSQQTPIWILALGSIGICTGLWAWGRAVMSTVADGLIKITPSKGFSIELGAAVSVLLATKLGLPISTTHCKIGSLVIVGLVSKKFLANDHAFSQHLDAMQSGGGAVKTDKLAIEETTGPAGAQNDEQVDLRLFVKIAATWVVTVPLAGLISAAVMQMFIWFALDGPN